MEPEGGQDPSLSRVQAQTRVQAQVQAQTQRKTPDQILNELRQDKVLCDVILKVESQLFHAHKVILCSCSLYFRTLFTGAWSDPSRRLYSIPGVGAAEMEQVVCFCYTRSAALTEANVEAVLAAADMLLVPGLVGLCCGFLERRLCPDNCLGLWRLLGFYHCPGLERKLFQFALCHFELVQARSSELLDLSVQQLGSLLQEDGLNVRQEATALRAVLRWVRHKPEERHAHLPHLLTKVRMGLVSMAVLESELDKDELIRSSPECEPVLEAARAAVLRRQARLSALDYGHAFTRPRLPSCCLFLTGGVQEQGAASGVMAYDNRADAWTQVSQGDPSERAHHGCVALGGWVYVIGGSSGADDLNSVWRFGAVARTWQQVAPMSSRRSCPSVAVLDGLIYVMGGFNEQTHYSTAERYDPAADSWAAVAPMRRRRGGGGAAALHGQLYVCGGFNGRDCLSLAERYSPDSNQWTAVSRMWTPRSGLGVVACRGRIYAIGGMRVFRVDFLSSVECYDPRSDAWSFVLPLSCPRSYFGVAVLEENILVVGGVNGFGHLRDGQCFDSEIEMWLRVSDLNNALNGASCCTVTGLHGQTAAMFPRGPLKDEILPP